MSKQDYARMTEAQYIDYVAKTLEENRRDMDVLRDQSMQQDLVDNRNEETEKNNAFTALHATKTRDLGLLAESDRQKYISYSTAVPEVSD